MGERGFLGMSGYGCREGIASFRSSSSEGPRRRMEVTRLHGYMVEKIF